MNSVSLARKVILLCASFFIFFFVWHLAAGVLNTFLFPSPLGVFVQLGALFASGEIVGHIFSSVYRVLVGLCFGVIIGALCGFALGLNSTLNGLFNPIVQLLKPIPPIAWIPIAILWFGIGDESSFFIIFIASFFPVFTNVFFGVTSLPTIFSKVSKSLNLSKWQNFVHVIFPFSMPYFLTGVKTSVGFSWMVIIAAEMIASQSGLGYFIEYNRLLLAPDKIMVAMGVIGFIGFVFHYGLVLLERKLLFWRSVSNE
jgi:ABC-type nitrate/sulfonate/bicarbonate transport system permease component